ncbi:MAG: hypothetical protein J1E63_05070 [Muribaculaceae bacterium]|nr:hypothetical protein [Muribaculaceae bacterium]
MLHTKLKLLLLAASISMVLMLQSCGSGREYLVIPHSVSTVSSVGFADLKLKADEYQILKTISETATVKCQFKKNEIKVTGGDGDFTYTFHFDSKSGWALSKFSGAASLGYFAPDLTEEVYSVPNVEEFSRRVAIARIISAVTDYHADAVIEPVTVTRVNNLGNNTIEYTTTVSAKLIVIK